MSKYAVNNEGIEAMRKVASSVIEAVEQIGLCTSSLRSTAAEYQETLGPHARSLSASLNEISEEVKLVSQPVQIVSEMLNDVADGYEDVIGKDKFGVDSQENEAQSKSGSFFGRMFGGGSKNNSDGNKFGSFDTGKYENGDTVVKGDNYEQYISEYYDSENSTYTSISDNPVIETISPSSIEGIHLGTTEANDPARFWGQHENGGTADSFKEIASHIPEVKAQLDSGRPLSDIQADPVLGRCADIYFEPSSIPRVVKNNGYYEFDSNGRHRILAARELGYDIPVKVIGIRTRK